MKSLIEDLYLTNRGFVTDDYQACLDHIDSEEIPLEYHDFESGTEIWGSWVVPQKWTVNEAYIETESARVLNYDNHPLHLISYSGSFEGWVSREELKDHVHTHPDDPEAIPWHFRQNYRPWDREWGFCASQNFIDGLTADEYYVCIDTTFTDGEMTVAEHTLPGERDETIVFAAHLDHTGMANDDLSGVAAGIEIMKRLADRPNQRYTYTLLIVQELVGSAAYLSRYTDRIADFAYCIFLEMLGNDNRLCLQRTFTEDTKLDAVAEHTLDATDLEYEVDGYRSKIGNDELIFEAPGYEIPTVSVHRFPYAEYHTHFDDPSIISDQRLQEAVSYVLDIVDVFENDFVPVRTFSGVPSLANPKYDLYLDPGQISLSDGSTDDMATKREFQDRLFRYLDGDHSAFQIATEFGLDVDFVRTYLRSFANKGLVSIEELPHPPTSRPVKDPPS